MKTEIKQKVKTFLKERGMEALFNNYKEKNKLEHLNFEDDNNDVILDILVMNFLKLHYGRGSEWEGGVICFEDNKAVNLLVCIHEDSRKELLERAINANIEKKKQKLVTLPESENHVPVPVTLNEKSYELLSDLISQNEDGSVLKEENPVSQIKAIREEPSIADSYLMKEDLFFGCNITDKYGINRIKDYITEEQMHKAYAQAQRSIDRNNTKKPSDAQLIVTERNKRNSKEGSETNEPPSNGLRNTNKTKGSFGSEMSGYSSCQLS